MTSSFISKGKGPKTVVFLHGVGSGKEGWADQQSAVEKARWRFLAIDAPGFGTTPLPQAPGFKPHVEELKNLLDDEGIKKAVLCGHSLGGMTAQEFFAAHPDRVEGLVLSATSPAFGKPDGDFQKNFLKARFEPFDRGMAMPDFAKQFAPKLMGENATEDQINKAVEVMSLVSVESYRLSMQTIVGFDQRANLGNINVPTLLIAGEQDTNAPAPMMKKMATHIAGCDYVELEQTGHMAPIENPDAFNKHLTAFLQRLN